jgi:hypothetical protein
MTENSRGSRFGLGPAAIRPDTPLLYLLPIFGILLLILIWSGLADFLAREQARVIANALDDLALRAAASANDCGTHGD